MPDFLQALAAHLIGYFPAMARIFAMMAIAPGIGSPQIPAQVRVLAALGIGLAAAPIARPVPPQVLASPTAFLAVLVSEACFGALIGVFAALLIEGARYAGGFVELQAGLEAAALFDPTENTQSSLLGQLYYLAAVVLFFDLNGHRVLLAAIGRSLRTLPPGTLSFPAHLGTVGLNLMASGFLLGVALALPTIAALMLTDLSFGLVARAVTRFNIFFVSLPAKGAITLISLAVSAPLLAHVVAHALGILTDTLLKLTGG